MFGDWFCGLTWERVDNMRRVVKCAFAHGGVCLSWGWPCVVDGMLKSRYWLTVYVRKKTIILSSKHVHWSPPLFLPYSAKVCLALHPGSCQGQWAASSNYWMDYPHRLIVWILTSAPPTPTPHPHPLTSPPSGCDWWKDWVNVDDSPDLNYEITFLMFRLSVGPVAAEPADQRQRQHPEDCGVWECLWEDPGHHCGGGV